MKEQIQMFESKKVRTVWDDEKEEWYFSIVDVVSVLNETDYQNARKYWKVLKGRLIKEGFEVVTNCYQFKLVAPDGKGRLTDVATPEQLFRIIQSIPSKKAEPFKQWMAQVAAKNGGVARNNGIGVKTDDLFEKISTLIEESRKKVATAVNVAEVYTKYEIGRYIVEDEQEGKYKAAYGKRVLAQLASQLQSKFGQGWGEDVLGNCRKFYIVYSQPQISDTVCRKSLLAQESEDFRYTVSEFQNAPAVPHKFVLSWSHYLVLMRVDNADARSFYEIEAAKENWSVPSSASCRLSYTEKT